MTVIKILIVSVLVVTLFGSIILVNTSEATSKYKANVDLTTSSDCWQKVTLRLTTGVEGTGKLLAK